MPFDTTYVLGTLLAIPTNFVNSGSLTFSPEARDNTVFLGKQEIDTVRSTLSVINGRISEDFGLSFRQNGFAGQGIITAIAQGAPTTVTITTKEIDGNFVGRPREILPIKGTNKKAATPTAAGPEVNLFSPSTATLGSLAVIVDTVGLSKVRNFTFNLIRVFNGTGSPLVAGQAVEFASVATASVPSVTATDGDTVVDFIGILAEDIAASSFGAAYSPAGGGAALVPATFATAQTATIGVSAVLSAVASPGGYAGGGSASKLIGVWKHVGGAGTAAILQFSPI